MDVSFELLSSMSPKMNRYRQPTRKPPTVLALKKCLRKSLVLENANTSPNDVSVIIIDSDSDSSSLTSDSRRSLQRMQSPIVVSDSGASSVETPLKVVEKNGNGRLLSQEKYTNIKLWVDEVNSVEANESMFSTVSTVLGDSGLKNTKSNAAASSTMLDTASMRFDQLFKKGKMSSNVNIKSQIKQSKATNQLVIDDSLLTDDDTPQEKEHLENNEGQDFVEVETLLDSLYGNSWREKKEEILPMSEPRYKNPCKNTDWKIPNTERCVKKISTKKENDNNLLKVLHKTRFKKALESPWKQSLKNVCDSDTDSDPEEGHKFQPVRLNFKDSDDEAEEKNSWTTESSNSDNCGRRVVNRQKQSYTDDKGPSFLASLSGSVPISRCDMSALIFRTNFKQNRDALAKKLFQLYNDKVFDNSIPKETPLEWNNKMRCSAGYCYCRKITRRTGAIERAARIALSAKVLDSADRLRDTLIHEMCHAATWIINEISDGHGSYWKQWANRAMRVFPELPPIQRCHQYVINTKYTYKCVGCGYSVGRHTKSLNTDTKRCGKCLGTFEVLINKITKKGEMKAVPATPKKPSAFALFIKENYATHKTPNLKHGDVMKILGQKFSSLKVD